MSSTIQNTNSSISVENSKIHRLQPNFWKIQSIIFFKALSMLIWLHLLSDPSISFEPLLQTCWTLDGWSIMIHNLWTMNQPKAYSQKSSLDLTKRWKRTLTPIENRCEDQNVSIYNKYICIHFRNHPSTNFTFSIAPWLFDLNMMRWTKGSRKIKKRI